MPLKFAKIELLDNAVWEGKFEFKKKFRFEFFPILITVICKGEVIKLCNSKIVLILVLVLSHESQIQSTFFSGSRASLEMKIKKNPFT